MSDFKSKLYLALPQGKNYGWGVCGSYLHKELPQYFDIESIDIAASQGLEIPGILFQALDGASLKPWVDCRAKKQIGYVFFEDSLNEISLRNAARSDLILAGSTWCCNRLKERGIYHSDLLLQGIDPKIFYPIETPPPDDKFVIFSGGKFEVRKGQDLVLKAFKILQDKYKDIHLVTVWANQWPGSLRTMALSPHIRYEQIDGDWPLQLRYLCEINGIDSSRVLACPLVPVTKMRGIFSRTHLGIFPNRCEGGTNLALMEYMACGKPTIVSAISGHLDIVREGNSIPLKSSRPFYYDNGKDLKWEWEEISLDELVAAIEYAYSHRDVLDKLGQQAARDMSALTWNAMAARVKQLLEPFAS